MTSNILNADTSVLLIVDIQEKLLAAQPMAEKIMKKISTLAKAATVLDIPTILTEQYPKGLGNTIEELKSLVSPSSRIIQKIEFSCIQAEGCLETLKSYSKNQIIICGVETHVCVHQTVNELLKNGFEVHLVEDAVGSRNKFEHKKGIKRMIFDGAIPTCTEIVLFELLKDSKHHKFKEIQSLIK